MAAKVTTVHRLKVTLRGVKPPIWRRMEVRSDTKLSDLAAVLEGAMGWLGGHLHSFAAGDITYQMPDDEDDFLEDLGLGRSVDERTARLAVVLPTVKSKIRWDYDFGDGWEHDVIVEAIEPARADVVYPICLTGKRACPPEDCGGPWGYAELLDAISDPTHEAHDERIEWVGPDFDPESFDPAQASEDMRDPRPLDGW